MNDKNNSSREFIREKIKEKPINRKKEYKKIGYSALSGLAFGLTAVLVIVAFSPIIAKRLQPKKENQGETIVATSTDTTEENMIIPELDPSLQPVYDYNAFQTMISSTYYVGSSCNKSIVTITSVVNSSDWFANSYEKEAEFAGLIISDTSDEILILTEISAVSSDSRINVTFINDSTYEASLKKKDNNAGLAVLSLKKAGLDQNTKNCYTVATFSSSSIYPKGSLVLALGSPLGRNFAIMTGSLADTGDVIAVEDHNYKVYTSDIVVSDKGSGFLFNTKGELMGIMMLSKRSADSGNVLMAVSASELKPIIDNLIAEKDIPYLGIKISTVNDKIAKLYELPKGVYIKEVTVDSPAMLGGLQAGDVITKVNNTDVATAGEYSETLMTLSPGSTYDVEVQRLGANGYTTVTLQVSVGTSK